MEEIREHPGQLTNAYREYLEQNKEEEEDKHDWGEWGDYHKTLGKLLGKTYPLKKKQTEEMEPSWILLMGKWGTEEDRDNFEYANKKEMHYKKQ